MSQGFVTVLRKHIRAEITNTPGTANALRSFRVFWNTIPAQKLLGPVASAVLSLSFSAGRAALITASIADAEIKQQKQNLFSCAAKVLFMPFSGAGIAMHRVVLGIGRAFTPGMQYSYPIRMHAWARSSEYQNTSHQNTSQQNTTGSNRIQREKAPAQQTLREYAQAVLASAKYEDLLSMYSPHHWPHLKTAYAGKELLRIHQGIAFQGPPKNTLVFTSDMYNEQEDTVTRLHNKWKLRSTGSNGAYKIHTAEVAPII